MPTPSQDESLLLYLNDAIATTRNKETLFRIVTEKLRLIFPFDAITILTLDSEQQYRRVFLRDYLGEVLLPSLPKPTQHSIKDTPIAQFAAVPHLQQYDLVDILRTKPNFEPFKSIVAKGMHYLTVVPLRTGGQLIGLLFLLARRRPTFTEADTDLLEKIGSLIAIAVNNTLAFEEIARREQEKDMQLALTNALLTIKAREELFQRIATEINRVVPCKYFGVRVQEANGPIQVFAEFLKQDDDTFLPSAPDRWKDVPEYEQMQQQIAPLLVEAGVYAGEPFRALATRYPLIRYMWEQRGTRGLLCLPLQIRPNLSATLLLSSQEETSLNEEVLRLLQLLSPQLTLAIQNVFAFEQIESLREQLERERTYLIDEINTAAATRFADFVGGSAAMQAVFQRIAQVAPTTTTVLITGETGTGKELVARALHQQSPRRERALVKVNCAALPAQLIESELFGHEKGAFTGAIERRIGKFELANGGTIFLDEIGELPLDLQAKLLRVLQEKEFERLGGQQVLRADVRVIAATNRLLADEVAAGRFRADLYYRLDVFPVRLPALRERPEDVEPLTRHFLERYTKQMGKPVRTLRAQDLRALRQYSWPGNVRELEHVVEQAVVVSQGPELSFAGFAATSPAVAPTPAVDLGNQPLKTLQEQERAHILAALQRTSGRVSGPNGAALLLAINPKTLEARMRKLGIRRTVAAE